MRLTHPTQISRSRSQYTITEDELRKVLTNGNQPSRLISQSKITVKESLADEHKQQLSAHIKELMHRDKQKPKLLQPINLLEDSVRKDFAGSYKSKQEMNLFQQNQRREIMQLGKWLDQMVLQLHNQHLDDYKEFYGKLEVIYSGSITEMQRQLSITGFEFGWFLKKLWDSFIDQITKVIDGLNRKNIQFEQQAYEETSKLHMLSQEAMKKHSAQLTQIKDEMANIQEKIAQLKKENAYLMKRDIKRLNHMTTLINQIDQQGSKLIELESRLQLYQHQESETEQDLKEVFEFLKTEFDSHKKTLEYQCKTMIDMEEFYDFTRELIQANLSELMKEQEESDQEDIDSKVDLKLAILKKYHAKYRFKEEVNKFLESSIIRVLRHAPQHVINDVKYEAQQYGVLQDMEVVSIQKRARTFIDKRTISPIKTKRCNLNHSYNHLFQAVDHKNKGVIGLREWEYLCFIFGQLDQMFSLKLFNQESDVYQDHAKLISFERFSHIADELQLFSLVDQLKLLDDLSFQEIEDKMKLKWYREKKQLKNYYKSANQYNELMKSMFFQVDLYLAGSEKVMIERESVCYIYQLILKSYEPYLLEDALGLAIPDPILLFNKQIQNFISLKC